MKKFSFAFMVLVVTLLSVAPLFSGVAKATTSITTCSQLQNLGSLGLAGDYVLGNTINCSGQGNFNPLGTFTGTFDGQGYSITGLSISAALTDRQALFGSTNGALIRNLTVSADVVGYSMVGVLIGSASNTVISNVTTSGSVEGIASFPTHGLGGGIVGTMSNSVIRYSSSSAGVTGYSYFGGLVGYTSNNSLIEYSSASGDIIGTNWDSGSGGLVGVNSSSTIRNSYATGSILGQGNMGGLVGTHTGSGALIDRSYSTGNVSTTGGVNNGGLIGEESNSATTTNSYWNTDTSLGSSADGTGKNNGQMQTQGTFTGWDFTNVWSIAGGQYPHLRAGDVTSTATPTGMTAVATGANVHIQWTNPADLDLASLTVNRDTGQSPSSVRYGTTVSSGTLGTSVDDNSLADGTYYYSVISLDTNGNSSLPVRASVTVDTTPPSAPTGFTAVQSGSALHLAWTNPVSDFASVTIRRNVGTYPANASAGQAVASGLTGTTQNDTGLSDGTYYYSIFALDSFGNTSVAAHATATLDTVLPVLAVGTSIATTTSDSTPNFAFTSTKAGTITYGGSCSSATTSASIGTNTVTFNTLADGTYSNCTVQVTDSLANASTPLSVGTFTVDTIPPALTAGTQVPSNVLASDAVYTFSASETGTYSLSGCAGILNTSTHTVTFASLTPGVYSCTLSVTDAAGLVSNTLTIGPFTIIATPRGHISLPVVDSASLDGSSLGFTIGPVTTNTAGTFVTLNLNANPATIQGYAASFDSLLSGTGIMPYHPSVQIPVPTASGAQTVYLRYYSTTGTPSSLITRAFSSTNQPNTEVSTFTRNLKMGMSGSDVQFLQQFLNTHGFVVSASGAGSVGQESTYYGAKVKGAVERYQKSKKINPASGIVGTLTRAAINQDSLQK